MPGTEFVPAAAVVESTGHLTPLAADHGSFHTIAYPPMATLATVSCSTTSGLIAACVSADGHMVPHGVQPTSPAYHLGNKACSLTLVLPLGRNGGPEVVGVTFTNNSREEGTVVLIATVSFPPEANQKRVYQARKLPAGESTFFHLVFNPV